MYKIQSINNPDQVYALKSISKFYMNPADISDLKNEINSLNELNHAHIVRFFELYEDKNNFYLR